MCFSLHRALGSIPGAKSKPNTIHAFEFCSPCNLPFEFSVLTYYKRTPHPSSIKFKPFLSSSFSHGCVCTQGVRSCACKHMRVSVPTHVDPQDYTENLSWELSHFIPFILGQLSQSNPGFAVQLMCLACLVWESLHLPSKVSLTSESPCLPGIDMNELWASELRSSNFSHCAIPPPIHTQFHNSVHELFSVES